MLSAVCLYSYGTAVHYWLALAGLAAAAGPCLLRRGPSPTPTTDRPAAAWLLLAASGLRVAGATHVGAIPMLSCGRHHPPRTAA
eukprot:COSAG01_NODE_2946_length_6812_cov_7.337107_5_plen_84_part_00